MSRSTVMFMTGIAVTIATIVVLFLAAVVLTGPHQENC